MAWLRVNHVAIGTATGAAGAILVDHYLRNGKDDPRVARKIGYVIPVIVGGVVIHYELDKILPVIIQNRVQCSNMQKISPDLSQQYLNETSRKQGYTESDTVFFHRLRDAIFLARGPQYENKFRSQFGLIMNNNSVGSLLNQCNRFSSFGAHVNSSFIPLEGRIMGLVRNSNLPIEESKVRSFSLRSTKDPSKTYICYTINVKD